MTPPQCHCVSLVPSRVTLRAQTSRHRKHTRTQNNCKTCRFYRGGGKSSIYFQCPTEGLWGHLETVFPPLSDPRYLPEASAHPSGGCERHRNSPARPWENLRWQRISPYNLVTAARLKVTSDVQGREGEGAAGCVPAALQKVILGEESPLMLPHLFPALSAARGRIPGASSPIPSPRCLRDFGQSRRQSSPFCTSGKSSFLCRHRDGTQRNSPEAVSVGSRTSWERFL